MLFLKYVFLVAACFILTASASAIDFDDLYEPRQVFVDKDYELILNHRDRLPYGTNLDYNGELKPILSRDIRSPHGQFPSGRISNTNGRGSSDAYAHATRNTDFTRKRF